VIVTRDSSYVGSSSDEALRALLEASRWFAANTTLLESLRPHGRALLQPHLQPPAPRNRQSTVTHLALIAGGKLRHVSALVPRRRAVRLRNGIVVHPIIEQEDPLGGARVLSVLYGRPDAMSTTQICRGREQRGRWRG
jgi:hypothetical protein